MERAVTRRGGGPKRPREMRRRAPGAPAPEGRAAEGGRTPRTGGGFRTGTAAALAAFLAALATGCGEEPVPPHEAACHAPDPGTLAAPIYTFRDEPLNLGREDRVLVDRWVEYFRSRRPERFALFYRRSGRYREGILGALEENGLPADFLYLALIESGMNPNAVSSAEAVGLWQFLESTGQVYGLEVGPLVDERRSPERATQAAINYLSDLHQMFGDWLLAAAAYNGGPGRLRRAIRRAGTRDFWELARGGWLPDQTAEYVPKIIAAAHLGRRPGVHGFTLLRPETTPAYDTVRLAGRSRLSVMAAAAGIEEWRLRELNPHLVGTATPGDGATVVRLPPGTRGRFREVWAHIPVHHRAGTLAHSVRRGETLGRIARSYGVSVQGLLSVNPDIDPRRLRVGQQIQVPAGG